jgi:protein involved in polysaccharide export with SLBB domain
MVRMNLIKSMMSGTLVALVLSLFAGCATTNSGGGYKPAGGTNAAQQAVAPPPVTSVGTFNVGDLVIVTFSGLSDVLIPEHQERVKEDGLITLPQIGEVRAEGKTAGELQKEIRSKYVDGRLYREGLNITVKGQERYFFVKGEVNRASSYVWAEGMTVLKAIASAGDFNDFAKRTDVTVTRVDGRQFKVNCKKAQNNPKLDLPIYPGDTIHVPRTWM